MGMFNYVDIRGWGFIPNIGWQTKSEDILLLMLYNITIHTDGSLSYEGGIDTTPPTFWQGTGDLLIHGYHDDDPKRWIQYSFSYINGVLQKIHLLEDGIPFEEPQLIFDASAAYKNENT